MSFQRTCPLGRKLIRRIESALGLANVLFVEQSRSYTLVRITWKGLYAQRQGKHRQVRESRVDRASPFSCGLRPGASRTFVSGTPQLYCRDSDDSFTRNCNMALYAV